MTTKKKFMRKKESTSDEIMAFYTRNFLNLINEEKTHRKVLSEQLKTVTGGKKIIILNSNIIELSSPKKKPRRKSRIRH
jgi:hypothetical protein